MTIFNDLQKSKNLYCNALVNFLTLLLLFINITEISTVTFQLPMPGQHLVDQLVYICSI
jgi:hypothetical protein